MERLRTLEQKAYVGIENPCKGHEGILDATLEHLLRGIEEAGSYRQAALRDSVSHSRAWRIKRDAEDSFGIKLTRREGATCVLTKEGRALLEVYDTIANSVQEQATRMYEERIG